MNDRTFGWIQDSSDLKKLRKVVEIFDSRSATHQSAPILIKKGVKDEAVQGRLLNALAIDPLQISYKDLVGGSSKIKCDSIVRAIVPGQKKNGFLRSWPADNFIRWAQALGFIEWTSSTDSFAISELGLTYSQTAPDSNAEYEILERALLTYPPVSRILEQLYDAALKNEALTKFEIGKNLGFIGEEGFTSMPQDLFVKELALADKGQRSKIRSNWEGDTDRYARGICSWLQHLKHPWVRRTKKVVNVTVGTAHFKESLLAYEITAKGIEVRKKLTGQSRFAKSAKLVSFEMLSTKTSDRDYLRHRRAHILTALSKKQQTIEELRDLLGDKGIKESKVTIADDIRGLKNIGLTIKVEKNKYHCTDDIVGLGIPVASVEKSGALEIIEKCRAELNNVPHEFLVLIPMSFEKKSSLLFEAKTMQLLTEVCGFNGLHLGGANRPDGIIHADDYGVIIDMKAYANGFALPASEVDKMERYLRQNISRREDWNPLKWWENFPKDVKRFHFLFISGSFGGNFKEQLKLLSARANDTLGAALPVYELLMIADALAAKNMDFAGFEQKISTLDQVKI